MSVATEITLFCDGCGQWARVPGGWTVNEFRKQMKNRGWIGVLGKRDLCGDCAREGNI